MATPAGPRPDAERTKRTRARKTRAEGAREIRIEGARANNLKSVTCQIPLGKLTVVSGVSGSGKSTLAFDTLYAEGQRRYVASLSTYARQFLERLPRPEVDSISHLPPAIAIEQRNRVTNARSTVGTATEILDHLRLLFARIGVTRCPGCGAEIQPGTVESVTARLLAERDGQRLSLGTRLFHGPKESATVHRERLAREGWVRVLDADGNVVDLTEISGRAFAPLRRDGLLLVDRMRLSGDETRSRLAEAVAQGFTRGAREIVCVGEDGTRESFREGSWCNPCERRFAPPEPALFSFNSPLGACPECQGFGRVSVLDRGRVVPDPSRSLAENAVAPFATPKYRRMQRDLMKACKKSGVPSKVPFSELDAEQQTWVFEGEKAGWYGVRGWYRYLEKRRYKVQSRILIARYRRFDPCPDCEGQRLRPDALCVHVGGSTIGDVSGMTIAGLQAWLGALELDAGQKERADRLLAALGARVGTAADVGLGYLGLSRQTRTLSGGEAQRIQLATALGGALTASLYVLDEPSIGLHPSDVERLLKVLAAIRDHGNTVVVVEHSPEIVSAADHVVDLGPGAGRNGGQLVTQGSVAEVRKHPDSLTGRALRGEIGAGARTRRKARGKLRIVGASENNLRDVTVDLPLGQLVAITGVSGAGKSTLIRSVLVGHLRNDPERGACTRIEGGKGVAEVVVVDQTPPTRSSRSNPGTVSKAFEGIRKRFAATREAKRRGLTPGWFSFNVAGGRCDACEGAGEVVVDMQFLDDVRVPCDACDGTRYRPEASEILLDGHTIVEVLDWTLEEVTTRFAHDTAVAGRLRPFVQVGLGYLTLGQPLSSLSGGEAQRMRLGLALQGSSEKTLYVLDEPTTGLHPSDVETLVACLDELIEAGGSVLVVEHSLEVIRQADHVIDLGPEGGPGGGQIVAEGTPEAVAKAKGSRTGAALRVGR
ncbi:MAG: excinuclease ABC subunit UvrA [Deltaproteobacteria bacterium]|nr:excinuclease ABC subunit UvrA [Deltaproteobacteria bacterium]MBW2447451.1 excinuclease ABC subunit UvrA [Deltaproteobacteria bacterium]